MQAPWFLPLAVLVIDICAICYLERQYYQLLAASNELMILHMPRYLEFNVQLEHDFTPSPTP